MGQPFFKISREKHLDHMVKVAPIIVGIYALQCFFIMKMGPQEFAVNGIMFLGACLASMIIGFITYDMTHAVNFYETHLEAEIKWLKYSQKISYYEIEQIEVSDPGQSFSTFCLTLKDGKKHTFYFVDDADKIKTWLEEKHSQKSLKVA